MLYAALKSVHVGCAAISIVLFTVRGVWRMTAQERLARRWVRIVPHVVDTLLLASAIALASMLGGAPFADGWLTAKVAGLLVYIVLGTIALKRGRTPGVRAAAFAGALLTFAYIVSVAFTKSPYGLLGGALAP